MSDLPIEDDQGRVDGLSDSRSRRLDQLAEVGQQLPRGGRFTPGIGGRGAVGGQYRPKQGRSLALPSRVPS